MSTFKKAAALTAIGYLAWIIAYLVEAQRKYSR